MQAKAAICDHALAVRFFGGFEISARIMLLGLTVTVAMIRVTRRRVKKGREPLRCRQPGKASCFSPARFSASGRFLPSSGMIIQPTR